MNNRKLIILDLDGTILNQDRKVSKGTKRYLNELKEKGYIITICTGRILASVLDATDGAEFANYIIADTGAAIYNAETRETIWNKTIDTETGKQLLEYYNIDCNYIDICNKDYIYKYSDISEDCPYIIVTKNKEEIIENCKPIIHATISMKNNQIIQDLYNELTEKFNELSILIMQDSFADRQWLEIQPQGCSKINAIRRLADYLNIKNEDIIAFGDGLNDIEMIEGCGIGVAMYNALDEVKNVSNYITTKSNEQDGVIYFLKEYLKDEKNN